MNKYKWSVQTKLEREWDKQGYNSWEITVIRDDNKHGKESWGWYDGRKLKISECMGSKEYFDKQITIAEDIASRLNTGIGSEVDIKPAIKRADMTNKTEEITECPLCHKKLNRWSKENGQDCSNPECDFWCWCKNVKIAPNAV